MTTGSEVLAAKISPAWLLLLDSVSSIVTRMVVPSGMTNSLRVSNKRPRALLGSSLAAAAVFVESASFAALGDVVQPASASGKTTLSTITTTDFAWIIFLVACDESARTRAPGLREDVFAYGEEEQRVSSTGERSIV